MQDLFLFLRKDRQQSAFFTNDNKKKTLDQLFESQSASNKLFDTGGLFPRQTVSNWAVWVMMWVLEIATEIFQVRDP